MNALDFLTQTIKTGASDLFIVAGRQLSFKKGGRIETLGEERLMARRHGKDAPGNLHARRQPGHFPPD